jgi:hypothetical protein
MGFGLVEYLFDNYLFPFTIIINLSNAYHVPSSVSILLYRYSRWSVFVLGIYVYICRYSYTNVLRKTNCRSGRKGTPIFKNTNVLGININKAIGLNGKQKRLN